MIGAILGFVLAIAFIAFLYQKCGKFVVIYIISDDRFSVKFLNLIPIFSVKLEDISNLKRIRFSETFGLSFFALRLGNRMFGEITLIEKSKGFFREILITPENTEVFISKMVSKKTHLETRK